jgi:hypothetical protein
MPPSHAKMPGVPADQTLSRNQISLFIDPLAPIC